MNYPFKFAGGPAEGPWPQVGRIEYSAYMRGGAATAGDLLQQDYTASDGDVSTAGATYLKTHIMANVIAPDAGGIAAVAGPYFGTALRSVANDALVPLCLFGYCSTFVILGSGNISIGDPMAILATKTLDGATAAGERIIAQAQEDITAPTSRQLGEVLINGVGSFCSGIGV